MLSNIPSAMPFEARANIFRYFIVNEKHNIETYIRSFDEFRSRTHATARRGHVVEEQFYKLGWPEPGAPHWDYVRRPIRRGVSAAVVFSCGVVLIAGGCTRRILMVGTPSRSSY
ncbi:hypothetical protein BJY52DRAFT_1312152 [Lactarius psammicola]|nr:hypothetical protein BJY52DRAFT_1312152 [Lactarius psammicola]